MGGFIGKIMGGGLLEGLDSIIGKFKLDPTKAAELEHDIKKLAASREAQIEETFRAELQAKERILVAELNQSDAYTKRARPTVVYAGLGFILLNYCVVPILQQLLGVTVMPMNLPTEFWMAWGGIVATWSIGRSAEKMGSKNKGIQLITGNS